MSGDLVHPVPTTIDERDEALMRLVEHFGLADGSELLSPSDVADAIIRRSGCACGRPEREGVAHRSHECAPIGWEGSS